MRDKEEGLTEVILEVVEIITVRVSRTRIVPVEEDSGIFDSRDVEWTSCGRLGIGRAANTDIGSDGCLFLRNRLADSPEQKKRLVSRVDISRTDELTRRREW